MLGTYNWRLMILSYKKHIHD